MLWEDNYLAHYGITGMRWGVRRFQNMDGSLTPEGKKRYQSSDTVFISGSSKMQDKSSEYYRKKLPVEVRKEIKEGMKAGSKFVVGDAPGIDRQVQDYLNKKGYKNVEIYGPGKEVRYSANKKWKTNPIDDPEHEPMSPEWLAKKDKAMTDVATKGLAVVLDEGAKATRNNVARLQEQNKDVKVFSLNKNMSDEWVTKRLEENLGSIKAKSDIAAYQKIQNDEERSKAGAKMMDKLIAHDELLDKEVFEVSRNGTDKRPYEDRKKDFDERNARANGYNEELSTFVMTELTGKSMDGYEGIPKSERQKALYDYDPAPDGIKSTYETYRNWTPKYEKTKAYRDAEKQIEKAKEDSGLNEARDLWYGWGKYKGQDDRNITMSELRRRQKVLREAENKFKEMTRESVKQQNKMWEEHQQKILKNALLDMGWPVEEKYMALIKSYIWYD